MIEIRPAAADTAVYTLPAKFFNDYAARCLEDDTPEQSRARYLSDGKTRVIVRLSTAESRDLLADAMYYADTRDGWWDESVRPLCQSAARTVAALNRQGVTA